jgi:hypothetical protein
MLGDVHQHGLGEIAVRVEKCEPLAGGEVLRDQIEKQRRRAGADLADDVEVSAALLGIEHLETARGRAPRTSCGGSVMGGTEPVCRAHRMQGRGAGNTLLPEKVRRHYMASSLCVMT